MLSAELINEQSYWISVFEPLPHEREDLINKYEVTKELLDYAIDPYEKARVEVDRDAGVTLLIFDVYVPTHEIIVRLGFFFLDLFYFFPIWYLHRSKFSNSRLTLV